MSRNTFDLLTLLLALLAGWGIPRLPLPVSRGKKAVLAIAAVTLIPVGAEVAVAAASAARPVERTLSASVYRDGEPVRETAILLKGNLRHEPFTPLYIYAGRFQLEALEPSMQFWVEAEIHCLASDGPDSLFPGQCCFFPSQASRSIFEPVERVQADPAMEEITVWFTGGTVVSTLENPPEGG